MRGYRFVRGTRTLVVAWYEDRVLQLPGAVETPVAVALPLLGATRATVTTAVTTPEQQAPAVATVPVTGGVVTLSLTSIPVFVEEAP